jgi:hypothetical protein
MKSACMVAMLYEFSRAFTSFENLCNSSHLRHWAKKELLELKRLLVWTVGKPEATLLIPIIDGNVEVLVYPILRVAPPNRKIDSVRRRQECGTKFEGLQT